MKRSTVGSRVGFTLIELMIVIAIIGVIAAIAIPGLLASQRASNERSASTSLKTLTSAQADFRSNDRDGNRISDYWTFNVCGLYTMTSGAMPGNTDAPIKLIELSMAGADAASSTPSGVADDTPLTSYTRPDSKASHWYNALLQDASAPALDNVYRVDTGGSPAMGAVHNFGRFGFIAWPHHSNSGKFIFMINENNTIYRSPLTGNINPNPTTNPPGALPAPHDVWPTDANLQASWNKLD